MGCVECGKSLRSTYVGNGKRAVRGDYCYACTQRLKIKQRNKKVVS